MYHIITMTINMDDMKIIVKIIDKEYTDKFRYV